jgi:DNA-binding GntR family transcriptional regulator
MSPSLLKLKPLNKPILREEVYTCIKEWILTGELAPGERISIRSLLRDAGMSQTPIREALLKLEQEGLVSRLPQGRFIASRFSQKDFEEIFGIRGVLESYAVSLALHHMDEKTVALLENNVRDSQRYLRRSNCARISSLNTEFHDILNGLCKNQRLLNIINDLRDHISQYRSAILRVKGSARISIEHHMKMIEAIKKKDRDLVVKLTGEHILRGKEIILAEIEKGNIKL